ncbi:Hypothetical protein NGAL_HAMBI2605_46980 [Neorhizobium galegae bv. orientalis]|nr:Hypothetical protein NGAL_HAMBI2605_46980 [Neorhizobium galegae bv. orientalis]
MTTFVVDASVVIKWVVQEVGTSEALSLLDGNALIAPDLILLECTNILWKKARRRELSSAEAHFAARLIEGSDLQLREMLPLLTESLELAIKLDHPAYDCIYLALALKEIFASSPRMKASFGSCGKAPTRTFGTWRYR